MTPWMETAIVAVIVGAAATYCLLGVWKFFRGTSSCGGGCGKPACAPKENTSPST